MKDKVIVLFLMLVTGMVISFLRQMNGMQSKNALIFIYELQMMSVLISFAKQVFKI